MVQFLGGRKVQGPRWWCPHVHPCQVVILGPYYRALWTTNLAPLIYVKPRFDVVYVVGTRHKDMTKVRRVKGLEKG